MNNSHRGSDHELSRVLIVEDDAILAYDLADQLASAGFAIIGPAASADQGLRLVKDRGCDIAVLDVNLGGDATSEAIAVELLRQAIPFIVVSGYTGTQHSAVFSGAPLLTKPVRIEQLISLLNEMGLTVKSV